MICFSFVQTTNGILLERKEVEGANEKKIKRKIALSKTMMDPCKQSS